MSNATIIKATELVPGDILAHDTSRHLPLSYFTVAAVTHGTVANSPAVRVELEDGTFNVYTGAVEVLR